MASTLKREAHVSLPSLPANRRSRGVLGLGSTLASIRRRSLQGFSLFPMLFSVAVVTLLSRLRCLARTIGDQFRQAGNGHKARILKVLFGKLHAKAIFNLRHEFNHFERSQQSGVKVICGQKLGSISLEFPAADKPGAQPFRSLFFQFVTHTGRHLSIAMQRTGEPSQPFNLSGRTTSSTSCDVRDFKLQMYSTSTTPAPSKTL